MNTEASTGGPGPRSLTGERPVSRQFRRKHVVEAVQWSGDLVDFKEIKDFADGAPVGVQGSVVVIYTPRGTVMYAGPRDWIVRGEKGDLYPVQDDVFRATYEAVHPNAT